MAAPTEVPAVLWSKPQIPRGAAGRQNHILGIEPNTWFSPLDPLPDFAPQEVQGRAWDYQVGYNLQITPRPNAKITFKMLRDLVDRCDIMGIIIDNRKDQIESLEWSIGPKEVKHGAPAPNAKKKNPQEKIDPRVTMLTEFFKFPDKVNTFDMWLRKLLDDLFIIDAPAVYVRRNVTGGVYALEVVDGATIALKIDQNGRTPPPPSPAYQQTLKGVPAISYTTDQLIYMPRNVRTHGVYGRSPVEKTFITIETAINRALFNRDYYLAGNVPDAIGSLPDDFTPQQAKDFTEWWDSMYSGNLAERRKVKFVPGMNHFEQLKSPEMKNVYDDYIARVLCFSMGISPQPFISQMNRATAEVSKVSTDEEGKVPVQTWIKNLINKVIQGPQFFNMPDLEFDYIQSDDQDPAQQQTILTGYVGHAQMTINESRERQGLDPIQDPMCDELGVMTATGFVTLSQMQETHDTTIETLKNPPQKPMAGSGSTDGDGKTKPSLGASANPPPGDKKEPAAKGVKKKSGIHTNLKRKAVVDAKARMAKSVHSILKSTARSVEHQLRSAIRKADEADLHIDLAELGDLDDASFKELANIAGDSGLIIIGQAGFSEENITKQVNQRAVAWARERAAEMVSQITETTRDMLRAAIADGLAENLARDQIISDIMDTSDVFSEKRAEFIADTELTNASSQGSLMGMKVAQENGVKLGKYWDCNDEPCPICQGNEDAGVIGLDETFPSGDDAPQAHPRCECVLLGITSDAEE